MVTSDEIDLIYMLKSMRRSLGEEITHGLSSRYRMEELVAAIEEKEKEVIGGFIQKNIKVP